jgi:hypothetical protein
VQALRHAVRDVREFVEACRVAHVSTLMTRQRRYRACGHALSEQTADLPLDT